MTINATNYIGQTSVSIFTLWEFEIVANKRHKLGFRNLVVVVSVHDLCVSAHARAFARTCVQMRIDMLADACMRMCVPTTGTTGICNGLVCTFGEVEL